MENEGTQSPFLLMKIDTQHITALVEEKIEGTDQFLVEVEVKPGKVSIFLDKPTGITIDECTKVHRHLKSEIDDEEFFERYDLEVGSPGMDRPLKVKKQYQRRVGKELDVQLLDEDKFRGVLKEVKDDGIEMVVDGNGDEKERIIDFNKIKEAKLVLDFGKQSKKK